MNDMCEAIENFDEVEKLGQCFSLAIPLEETDIGDEITPRPTFVNKKNYVDCFAWNYRKMSGLSRELVEHQLPIKSCFRPYKQPARTFNPIIHDQIKEEVERLLDVGYI
jgi:hypothetical protein